MRRAFGPKECSSLPLRCASSGREQGASAKSGRPFETSSAKTNQRHEVRLPVLIPFPAERAPSSLAAWDRKCISPPTPVPRETSSSPADEYPQGSLTPRLPGNPTPRTPLAHVRHPSSPTLLHITPRLGRSDKPPFPSVVGPLLTRSTWNRPGFPPFLPQHPQLNHFPWRIVTTRLDSPVILFRSTLSITEAPWPPRRNPPASAAA